MMADLESWCDETLPDLYDPGMFDYEEIYDEVMEAVMTAIEPYTQSGLFSPEDIEDIKDAAESWFHEHHTLVLESLPEVNPDTVAAILVKNQTPQHSAEWYTQKTNILTASEIHDLFTGSREALLRKKSGETPLPAYSSTTVGIAQENGEMMATKWGHRFEPIVRKIYEIEISGRGSVCDSLGRFVHKEIPWLAASPDGIVTKGPLCGRLVEIKAPKTRDPGTFVPPEYYEQMQLQMEVTDLEAAEFIEAQFVQRHESALTQDDLTAIECAPWKGRIQVRGSVDNPPDTWRYIYSEPEEDLKDAQIDYNTSDDILESSVWWLTGFYPRTVLRNHEWWASVGSPAVQAFWADVLARRKAIADGLILLVEKVDSFGGGGWMGSSD